MKEMQLLNYLPLQMRGQITVEDLRGAEEMRIRVGQPFELLYGDGKSRRFALVDRDELCEMLNYLTGYSLYALEEEMKQGFFTIAGGHRVGICGHMSYHNAGVRRQADALCDISGLNIRIAHELRGCAKEIIPYIRKGDSIYNTLIFAPPGVGKTTYLRDCIRILSSGEPGKRGIKVGVVDERSEIAACHQGVAQNDLGPRTDVLDNCPKELGMQMMLRSMSPEILAVDELGGESDFAAVEAAMHTGVRILGTVHAGSRREISQKPHMSELLSDGEWRFVRLARDDSGVRHVFVYNTGEEGVWVR